VLDLNDDANLSRLLTFRISGDLQVYPRPQQVEFDSRLDRVTSLFEVDSK
jgi:predicted component of type VI protein secretion system